MTGGTTASPVLLGCAVAAVAGAVASDLAVTAHPVHSVVLGAVALVAALLSRPASGVVAAVPAVAAALAVQPVLHVTADATRPSDDLPHLLLDGATAGVQIVVPALALIAASIATQLLWLVVVAVRARTRVAPVPPPPRTVLLPPPPVAPGTLLRRCGWAILAARRGPPVGHAAH